MALQLRIISDHRRQLGSRSTLVLAANGATIGRAADNQWVLPDPQRYVSAHHARIHYRDGLYILEDISTNGIFVNDEDRPVAERGAHVLRNGDLVRLGEYEVVVVLDPEAAALPPPAEDASPTAEVVAPDGSLSVQVHALPSQVEVIRGIVPADQSDLDASLNLDDLLWIDPAEAQRLAQVRVNAFGHPVDSLRESDRHRELTGTGTVNPADTNPHGPDPADTSSVTGSGGTPMRLSALIADAHDTVTERRALAQKIARLARAAELAQERHAQAQPQAGDLASGLAAFCKGAGIDPAVLPGDAQNSLLHLAGLLCRESLLGLKDLERVRRSNAATLGINLPEERLDSQDADLRPSLARMTVEELLTQVLSQHQSRRLDAVQWLRESLDAARTHDHAVLQAMQAAFTQFIARLDPVELESRFQRGLHKSTGAADARYWTLFGEFYRSITEMPSGRLPHVFLEAFTTAYRELCEHKD